MKTFKPTFETRKMAIVVSLYAIGESRIAADFEQAHSKESFEYCEHVMRCMLRRIGPDCPNTAKTLANAILEAQMLPSLLVSTPQ